MMWCNVLKHYHPMLSIPCMELHQAVLPPSVVPVPKVPHFASAALFLGPWGALTGKPNLQEFSSSGGVMMSQGTDIGPLIPHVNVPPIPPNALLPIIILTSGSKSHFGAHSHVAPNGPVAICCGAVINFNLNCAGPAAPPMPAGLVLGLNTHVVGTSIGDLISGALHMVADALIQTLVNRFFALTPVSDFLEDIAQTALGPIMRAMGSGNVTSIIADAMERSFPRLGQVLGQVAEETLFNIPSVAASLILGTPLGYSPGWSPIGGQDGAMEDIGHDAAQKAVDKYLRTPEVDEYPDTPGDFPNDGTPAPLPMGRGPLDDDRRIGDRGDTPDVGHRSSGANHSRSPHQGDVPRDAGRTCWRVLRADAAHRRVET